MKILNFDGFLAKDAEVKQTPKGNSYLNFKVGNTTYIKGENKTEFIDVTSFNSSDIEHKTPYLKKGAKVFVSGVLDSVGNLGKDGRLFINHHVLANYIEFSGGSNKKEGGDNAASAQATPVEEPSIAVSSAPVETDYAAVEANTSVSVLPSETSTADSEDDLPF